MPTLGERLRAGTHELHQQVERSTLMHRLLRGELERHAYAGLLRNLHALYAALEAGLAQHAGDAAIAPLEAPALARGAALERDLCHFHGPGWRDDLPLVPACAAYVARLHELQARRPALLLAHAYVRYLGDLYGGQTLRRIVARSFGMPEGQGTAFHDFGDAAEVRRRIAVFRDALARIGSASDPATVEAIADEAVDAFRRHRELFEQLAAAYAVVPLPAVPAAR